MEVPLADPGPESAETGATAAPSAEVDLAHCSVLVVEDDSLARRALVDLLRSWGCEVTEAEDADAAKRALEAGLLPRLVVSDFRLPDNQTGIDLVQWARKRLGRTVAAFLLSGDTNPAVMAAARDAELPLVHKPVKAARLRTTLQLLLGDARFHSG